MYAREGAQVFIKLIIKSDSRNKNINPVIAFNHICTCSSGISFTVIFFLKRNIFIPDAGNSGEFFVFNFVLEIGRNSFCRFYTITFSTMNS